PSAPARARCSGRHRGEGEKTRVPEDNRRGRDCGRCTRARRRLRRRRQQGWVAEGAGSTFVFPLVSQWQANYKNAQITYGSVGSGAGIAAITARTVDFGASDAPLTKDQASACKGCEQIPWALSSTSIPYHVPGVAYGLKLTGKILANIYLGHITKWNASAIKKINPGVNLPDLKITPVFRSDGSGTSWNFTDYLSRVSPEWKSKIGVVTQPSFPTGIGGKGSSGL